MIQLANGRSPLDVRRRPRHSTLKMTEHYASLTVQQLQKSHEQQRRFVMLDETTL